ncbi:MAG: TolC family protein [Bryobacteraceae bacterium]|nr:TolC family protein [Bryobacteraceae bacterium]
MGLFFACSFGLLAEVHNYTLKQSVERAIKQSPDILMARFEEAKAVEQVLGVKDPFTPKLIVGSGLAYSSGLPMSIEGSAPSIIQARAIQTLYNRPLSFQVAAARENARGAAIDTASRRDDVIHRVADLHLTAERSGRIADLLRQQVESFQKVADAVRARVEDGRELPIESRAAELRIAQARQRLTALEAERDQNETALSVALGLGPDDRVRPVVEDRRQLDMPTSEAAAANEALANSKQVRRLESALQAKQLEATGGRSGRYPKVDLVAQYALLARYNNYEDFFSKFQRHNGQLGMSFQLPLFDGSAGRAQAAQAELEISRLRVQINSTRDRLAMDARRSWQNLQTSDSARELAKLDLDVTRERLNLALAQFEEGRVQLRQIEELRSAESEKWLAFYDAQTTVERARLEVLRLTGTIIAALQ